MPEPKTVHFFKGDETPTEEGELQESLCDQQVPYDPKEEVKPEDHICACCMKAWIALSSKGIQQAIRDSGTARRVARDTAADMGPIGVR